MSPRTRLRTGRLPWRPLLLAALALGLGGCGLRSYEEHMAYEQVRMERFDEANEYLGAPLEIPKPKDPKGEKELDVPAVFLRPPRGIYPKPDKSTSDGPFVHYGRAGQRPAGKAGARLVYSDVYVWVAPADQPDFTGMAYRAFASQLEGVSPKPVTEHPLQRVGGGPNAEAPTLQLVFNPAYPNPAPGGLSLYICQRGGANVAIAYQLDKGQAAPRFTRTKEDGTQETLTVTDLSLESLGVGKEAALLRQAYGQRARHQ